MTPLRITFAADHPTAAGHFPGNPIIPGALLLDAVIRALIHDAPAREPITIRAAKFFHPLRPGDTMRVEFTPSAGTVNFACHHATENTLLAAGTLIGPCPA